MKDKISRRTQTRLEEVYLKTPDFSKENILGYKVGIRPYRKNGIRIEAEYLNNQLLIHNYGYGNLGLSLSWGGAQTTISILNREQIKNPAISRIKTIAVLGAGVIGMATAYDLLSHGYQVTIYADKFSPDLTSNVGIGHCVNTLPYHENLSLEQKKLLHRMLAVSNLRYSTNLTKTKPEFSGVKFITDYRFKEGTVLDRSLEKLEKIPANESYVQAHFSNEVSKAGKRIKTIGLDGKLFIDDLYSQIKVKGALFKKTYFKDKNDIKNLSEAIIINCTSMGSREIFNDNNLIPIRGHLIYVKSQEGINYSLFSSLPHETGYHIILYPWSDRLILGGVFEKGVEETTIDQAVINKLLQNAHDFFNSKEIT